MDKLVIVALNEKGAVAIQKYVEFVTNPSWIDKVKQSTMKGAIKKLTGDLQVPVMVSESYDDLKFDWIALTVHDEYVRYADELISRAKLTYLEFFKKYGADDTCFSLEVK